MVDSRGRVVGVNTAVLAGAQGICLAIPAATASWVAGLLIKVGHVSRPHLGIAGQLAFLNPAVARAHRLPSNRAVQVINVVPGSPADHAGLRVGDVIVSLAGQQVSSVDDVHRVLGKLPIGSAASLEVLRAGMPLKLGVHLAAVA